MAAFLQRDLATDEIVGQWGKYVPDFVGPEDVESQRPIEEGYEFILMTATFDWAARPSPTAAPQWNSGAPIWIERMSLADFKEQRASEVTAAQVAANASHFIFDGKRISVDEDSFRKMQATCSWVSMTQTMPDNWPGGWKAMDGADPVLFATVPEWITFYGAMVQTGLANYNRSLELRAAIEAATTHAEVAAITW
jgi:hypothetical protein